MARQCCRDSAAMWAVAHGETDGDLVPCRWGCEGYARFENGKWHFAEDESVERRHATKADLLAHPDRQKRISDVLRKPLLPCHTCGHKLVLVPADNRCPVCTHDFAAHPGSRHIEPQGTLSDLQMEMDRHHGRDWKDT